MPVCAVSIIQSDLVFNIVIFIILSSFRLL